MNINEYLDNVRKIRKFAEERWGKSETTYARGYNYAREALKLSPTKETYKMLVAIKLSSKLQKTVLNGLKKMLKSSIGLILKKKDVLHGLKDI